LYIPALIQHLDPLNGVYPNKKNQSPVDNNAFTDIDTNNDPFPCQIANFNAGWSGHATEDVRLVGRRNLGGEFEEFQLRPQHHHAKLNKPVGRVFPCISMYFHARCHFVDALPLDPPLPKMSFKQAK
jgi:hypothetical protein